jgi:CTD kinase subunit alpha
MSDRYVPSGPKSFRSSGSGDGERGREGVGKPYKSQFSSKLDSSSSSRDYYAGPPLGGRHGPDGPKDPYRSNSRDRRYQSDVREFKETRRDLGPPRSIAPANPSKSTPSVITAATHTPVGPKGNPARELAGGGPPPPPGAGRPSGPSGFKKAPAPTNGDLVSTEVKQSGRKALPPQESVVGAKRPYNNPRDDANYRKKQQHYDYGYGGDGYNGRYKSGYSNDHGYDQYEYRNNNSNRGRGGYKGATRGNKNGGVFGRPGPTPKKAPKRVLAKSQIYSIKTMRPTEIYARVQQVGEGTYGKVYKARNSITDEYVALKRLRLETEREGFPITAIREIKLLQSFSHPNVVGLLEMMVEHNQIYMIFDYLDHDLTGLLTHPDLKLEEQHRKFIFKQLMEGLNYLHKRRVIHRDIKGSNILLDSCGVVKIADFGLARTMKVIQNGELPDYTNRVITIWYRPPELLLGSTDYGREVDVWGVGCLLVELYTKLAIFQGFDEVGQLHKIFNVMGTPSIESWPTMDDLPWFEMLKPRINKASQFAQEFRHLMTELSFDLAEKLLTLDPHKRLSAEQALQHPFFSTDPAPEPLYFLKELKGEWHEFETKKRRRKERKKAA